MPFRASIEAASATESSQRDSEREREQERELFIMNAIDAINLYVQVSLVHFI